MALGVRYPWLILVLAVASGACAESGTLASSRGTGSGPAPVGEGGEGGATSSAGSMATGGSGAESVGGSQASTGGTSTAGASSFGGASSGGMPPSTGGMPASSGGTVASGGAPGSGGAPSSGGMPSGGTPSTGGAASGGSASGGSDNAGSGGASSGGASSGGAGGATGSGGAPPFCSQPAEGCHDGNQSRSGCDNARVIGRIIASSPSGYFTSGSTCSNSNKMEGGSCGWDFGRDHTYRMWLRAGDEIDVTITQGSSCDGSWDRVFKVYRGNGCDDKSCAIEVECRATGSGTFNRSVTADADGWYVIVVDGRTAPTAFDDAGSYNLTVRLSCMGACGC